MTTPAPVVRNVVERALERQDVQILPADVPHATTRVMQAIQSAPEVAVVPVKSAWMSKVNWTQAVAFVASMLVIFGIDLDATTQVAIVGTIQGLQAALTWVIKTWFTDTVTPQSAGKG